jgi:hypothetical protein
MVTRADISYSPEADQDWTNSRVKHNLVRARAFFTLMRDRNVAIDVLRPPRMVRELNCR